MYQADTRCRWTGAWTATATREQYIRPRDEVFNMDWQPPPMIQDLGARLVKEYKIRRRAADQLLDVPQVSAARQMPTPGLADSFAGRWPALDGGGTYLAQPRRAGRHAAIPGMFLQREFPEQAVGVERSEGPPAVSEADGRVAGARRRRRLHQAAAREDHPVRQAARGSHSRAAAVLRDRDAAARHRAAGCWSKATRGGRPRSKATRNIPPASARPTCLRRRRFWTSTIPDRAQTVTQRGEIRAGTTFLTALRQCSAAQKPRAARACAS